MTYSHKSKQKVYSYIDLLKIIDMHNEQFWNDSIDF